MIKTMTVRITATGMYLGLTRKSSYSTMYQAYLLNTTDQQELKDLIAKAMEWRYNPETWDFPNL